MRIELSSDQPVNCATAALIVGCWEDDGQPDPLLAQLDSALEGTIGSLYQKRSRLGEVGAT